MKNAAGYHTRQVLPFITDWAPLSSTAKVIIIMSAHDNGCKKHPGTTQSLDSAGLVVGPSGFSPLLYITYN